VTVSSMIGPEHGTNNSILTGLTGLADRARLAYRVANQRQETPRSELTDVPQRNSYVREASPHRSTLRR
jgi:hypothetical protein